MIKKKINKFIKEPVKMNKQQICKIKEYAEKMLGLCNGETIQPFKLIKDGHDAHFEACEQNAYNAGEALNKARLTYRKKVLAILEDDWVPIVRIFEDNKPQKIARLNEMRQSILCHTDPNNKYESWLEPRDGKFSPNEYLSCAIDKLTDELLQTAAASDGKGEDTEKIVGTEQKTALRRRIWISVKRIPRWIYVLIIFLSALLTCIYFLWWLLTTFFV